MTASWAIRRLIVYLAAHLTAKSRARCAWNRRQGLRQVIDAALFDARRPLTVRFVPVDCRSGWPGPDKAPRQAPTSAKELPKAVSNPVARFEPPLHRYWSGP